MNVISLNMRYLILIVCFTQVVFAQKVCTDDEITDYNDINSISIKKCKNNSGQLSENSDAKFNVFKARFLKRRAFKNISKIKKVENYKNAVLITEKSSVRNYDENSFRNKVKSITLLPNKIKGYLVKLSLSKSTKTISFSKVSHAPSFLQQNNISFNDIMSLFIRNNLKYPQKALEEKIEGIIKVNFIIDINGKVKNVTAISNNAKNDILKKEAIRIINKLPQFIPGKHNGERVKVSYSFPMFFRLNK